MIRFRLSMVHSVYQVHSVHPSQFPTKAAAFPCWADAAWYFASTSNHQAQYLRGISGELVESQHGGYTA
jgi:hypothetical protein